MSALSTVRALGQPGRLHAKATHACAGEGGHLFTLYLSTCGEQKDGPGIKDATPFFYSTDGSFGAFHFHFISSRFAYWHGATPTTAMTHIAIQEALNGKPVDWLEHVTDEQYRRS
jgi:hypothetical protein